jgi:MFS transporter, OFA family, oxalate/formate antiporter
MSKTPSDEHLKPGQGSAVALLAATIVNLPFGTLYAFSVFLRPMEALLGATRAEMSFVFGLATVTLTLGMNFAPQLYRRLPPVSLAVACGLSSGTGLWLAASASSFMHFALGYGLLFGPGAGVLFIVAQQAVNQTVGKARGLANGYVVSLYPLGAMLGAPVFGWSIQAYGVRPTLAGLGVVVLVACATAAALLRAARIQMRDVSSREPGEGRLGRTFYLLTAVFFLAAAAGLTVLSQAAAIVQAYGGGAALAVGATTFITGAVGAARIAGGWLVDHFAAARVGIGAHACSLAGAACPRLLARGCGGVESDSGAGDRGVRPWPHRGGVRHCLGARRRRDRAALAQERVRARSEPPLHRLVRGGDQPAGARGRAI